MSLPDELLELINRSSSLYRTPFGLAGLLPTRWWHLSVDPEADHWILGLGDFYLRGFCGHIPGPRTSWRVPPEALAKILQNSPGFPTVISSWEREGFLLNRTHHRSWVTSLSGPVFPELTWDDVVPQRAPHLAGDPNHHYYWSDRFDRDFYRSQARAGFIAVTRDRGDEVFLLPELQHAYAVLHWSDLNPDKAVQKILHGSRMEEEQIRLVFNPNPGPVLDHLEDYWSDESWLRGEYSTLMRELGDEPFPDFQVWGVELRWGSQGELAAGELGYTCGSTYTSLTGFLHRERPEWNNFGKLQLVLMARELERRGYAFHNLGHPYMEYKIRLGAKVLPRLDFLALWDRAVKETPRHPLSLKGPN